MLNHNILIETVMPFNVMHHMIYMSLNISCHLGVLFVDVL